MSFSNIWLAGEFHCGCNKQCRWMEMPQISSISHWKTQLVLFLYESAWSTFAFYHECKPLSTDGRKKKCDQRKISHSDVLLLLIFDFCIMSVLLQRRFSQYRISKAKKKTQRTKSRRWIKNASSCSLICKTARWHLPDSRAVHEWGLLASLQVSIPHVSNHLPVLFVFLFSPYPPLNTCAHWHPSPPFCHYP